MPFRWIIGAILFSHLAIAAESENRNNLVLVTPSPPTNLDARWATEVYSTALHKLGYSLEIRRCEPMLCTLLANRGEVDGELLRAAMYQSFVPELIKLTEPGLSLTWSAYSMDKQLGLQSWQDIRDSGLRVIHLSGVPYVEKKLSGGVVGTELTRVRHWRLGLDKLKRGEADIFVESEGVINSFLESPEYDGIYRTGVIEMMPLYLYLNKKHRHLATKLSLVLAEMEAEGQTDKIRQTIVSAMGED